MLLFVQTLEGVFLQLSHLQDSRDSETSEAVSAKLLVLIYCLVTLVVLWKCLAIACQSNNTHHSKEQKELYN